jgi:dTDP-4-amino-4,6-dideoxygalactose transaminase
MNANSPRILLIGGTYRAVCALERMLERGERVVAFIGVEAGDGDERDFCPEILELCERAGIPARSGHKLGEEVVRWLEDRIRPDLAIVLGGKAEVPLSIGGNCRLGLVEISDRFADPDCPGVVLRQRGQEILRREFDLPAPGEDTGDAFMCMLEAVCECLESFLEQVVPPRSETSWSVPFESAHSDGDRLVRLTASPDPGAETDAFEREAAAYLGADRVFALRSPGEAFLALAGELGLGSDDEVIVPGVVSAAALDALRALGIRPVFADVHPERLTLSAAAAAAAITPRTRGILVAHPLGQSAELDALYGLAEERGLELIEDGCESLGARFDESRLGRSPCACIFRLPLGAHAPGFQACLVALPHAFAEAIAPRIAEQRVGDGLAGLARRALGHWEDRISARRRIASAYSAELSRYDAFRIPPTPEHALPTYSGYLLRLTRFARTAADDLAKLLTESGIETRRLRLPLAERDLASLPAAEHARATGILLPIDESLTDSQRDRVLDEIFGYAIG